MVRNYEIWTSVRGTSSGLSEGLSGGGAPLLHNFVGNIAVLSK